MIVASALRALPGIPAGAFVTSRAPNDAGRVPGLPAVSVHAGAGVSTLMSRSADGVALPLAGALLVRPA